MAFVNEYVSEEDIKKYSLEEDWIRRNPQYRPEGRPASCRLKWTIDRERNIYFMVVGGGGREENFTDCILNWDGKELAVRLVETAGGSKNLNEVPFKIIWDLEFIRPSQLDVVSHQEIVLVLKEVLTVFGYDGARRQIPNSVVEFKF